MIPNPLIGNGEQQRKLLNSLKPVVKVIAVVAAREAGVYLYKLALNKVHTEWIKAKVKDKLNVIRRDFGRETDPEPDPRGTSGIPDDEIQNGVDPEGPSPRSRAAQRAAQRRVRDETGRFIRKDPPQEGGDRS